MELNPRQIDILEYIKENKHASVKELSKKFYVCEMTIRRCLSSLENLGCIRRYSGGAIYNEKIFTFPIESRAYDYAEEKKKLCQKASVLVEDGMTVFIDNSATCTYLPPLLTNKKDIKIVTNSILIPTLTHAPCFVVGGKFFEKDRCMYGAKTISEINELNFDLAFFSSMGLSEQGVVSDDYLDAAETRKAVIKNSKKSVFLFDKSKLNKEYMFKICDKSTCEIFTLQ